MSETMTIAAMAGWFCIGWIAGHNWLHKRTKDDTAVVAVLAKHMRSLNDKMQFVGDGVRGEIRMTVTHRSRDFDIVIETPSRSGRIDPAHFDKVGR